MNTKTALVLSGGGMHGAFQLGALLELRDQWGLVSKSNKPMKFDIVAGVSAGALNGLLVAIDKLDELHDLWKRVGDNIEIIFTSDFIDTKSKEDKLKIKIDFELIKRRLLPNTEFKFGTLLKLVLPASRRRLLKKIEDELTSNFKNFRSIADNTPLATTLSNYARVGNFAGKDVKYKCGYVSLDRGSYHSVLSTDFASDADFLNGVLASTSMPVVWAPVKSINAGNQQPNPQTNCVDGGIRNSSPLGDVIEMINEDPENDYQIVIINCHNGDIQEEKHDETNIASIALRSLADIALAEIFNNDIITFERINNILKQLQQHSPGYVPKGDNGKDLRRFEAIKIEPNDNKMMGDSLVATPDWIAKRILHGRERAREAIKGLNAPPLA